MCSLVTHTCCCHASSWKAQSSLNEFASHSEVQSTPLWQPCKVLIEFCQLAYVFCTGSACIKSKSTAPALILCPAGCYHLSKMSHRRLLAPALHSGSVSLANTAGPASHIGGQAITTHLHPAATCLLCVHQLVIWWMSVLWDSSCQARQPGQSDITCCAGSCGAPCACGPSQPCQPFGAWSCSSLPPAPPASSRGSGRCRPSAPPAHATFTVRGLLVSWYRPDEAWFWNRPARTHAACTTPLGWNAKEKTQHGCICCCADLL